MAKRALKAPEFRPVADRVAERLAYKRAMMEQEITAQPLQQWEKDFCHWLALNPGKKNPDQLEAASAWAGTDISLVQLKTLKLRKSFRELFRHLRGEAEEAISEAREKFAKLAPRAADIYEKVLDQLEASDGLEMARAAPPILTPLLDRAWPKQHEAAVTATQVNITLSTHQQKAIDEAPIEVIAEEVRVT